MRYDQTVRRFFTSRPLLTKNISTCTTGYWLGSTFPGELRRVSALIPDQSAFCLSNLLSRQIFALSMDDRRKK